MTTRKTKIRIGIFIAFVVSLLVSYFFYHQYKTTQFSVENWSYCTQRKPVNIYPYRESCLKDLLASYSWNDMTFWDLGYILGPCDRAYYDSKRKIYVLEYEILNEHAGDGDPIREKSLIFALPSDGKSHLNEGVFSKHPYVRNWKREDY